MGKPKNAFHRWMEARALSCIDVRALLKREGVKVTRQAVHHWRIGAHVPRLPVMKAIVVVTEGAVPLESW